MKALKTTAWILVSLLCAVSFGFVTGLLNPEEKVNGLWLVTAAGCFYVLAYRFYGGFLGRRVMQLDDERSTPAFRLEDGTNYYPANKYVLFGHHFAAIAGAGPLLGPVLAAQFGFLPGFLWIVIGAVLAGAVQDFVILVGSLRRNGRSLPEIARAEIGWVTGTATAVAVLFIVIVALAGLGLAVVNALVDNPWGTFTIAMTIPIAFLMGWYHHHIRPGRVGEMSLMGIVLLVLAVVVGKTVAQSDLAIWFTHDRTTLVWLLAGYGFLASVLPMWMLLVPRDYLSTFMKLGVIGLLAIGVIILAPDLHMPAVTGFIAGGGPIIPGPLFPFLFITIACGAISGFHSLVSSGTTPKMIARESQAMVGYGAMLLESFVGVVALISASLLDPGRLLCDQHASPGRGAGGHGIPRSKHPYAFATGRSGRLRPSRRCGLVGRGHGLDFFRPAGDGRAHGLLVPICAPVRSPVYPHDHRRGHARGALSDPGNGRLRVCSASPNQLVARRHPVQRACGRGMGMAHRHGHDLHGLAHVRSRQPVIGNPGVMHRHDPVHQNGQGPLPVGDGRPHGVRGHHHLDGLS